MRGVKNLVFVIFVAVCITWLLAEPVTKCSDSKGICQWEYGEYRYRADGRCRWQDAERTINAKNLIDFFRQMKAKSRGKSKLGLVDAMNAIGDEGWEFVCIDEDLTGTMYYWFKKPK